MTSYTTDTELFRAFHEGEADAVQSIYQLYYKPLCFFAQRFTEDHDAAQDIATDSFIKMLDKRLDFQNLSNVRSFLYLVTKNACLNQLKANKRHDAAHRQLKFLTAEGEEAVDQVKEELLRLEVLQAIHAEIELLPGRCKEIFKLLFIEELSTDEIAQRLDISPQTVRTQKARALQLIKTELLKKNLIGAFLYLLVFFPDGKIS